MPRQKVSCLENRRLLTTTTKFFCFSKSIFFIEERLLFCPNNFDIPSTAPAIVYVASLILKSLHQVILMLLSHGGCKRPHRRHRVLQLLYCGIALTHSMHRNSLALTCVSVPFSFCSLVPCKIVRDVISFKDVDL